MRGDQGDSGISWKGGGACGDKTESEMFAQTLSPNTSTGRREAQMCRQAERTVKPTGDSNPLQPSGPDSSAHKDLLFPALNPLATGPKYVPWWVCLCASHTPSPYLNAAEKTFRLLHRSFRPRLLLQSCTNNRATFLFLLQFHCQMLFTFHLHERTITSRKCKFSSHLLVFTHVKSRQKYGGGGTSNLYRILTTSAD